MIGFWAIDVVMKGRWFEETNSQKNGSAYAIRSQV